MNSSTKIPDKICAEIGRQINYLLFTLELRSYISPICFFYHKILMLLHAIIVTECTARSLHVPIAGMREAEECLVV
jgi:hypothetical protein